MKTQPVQQALAEAVRKIDEDGWDNAQATSLGGAAFCFALIALLAQIGLPSDALRLSFFLAACGVPTWLALWQIGQAYEYHGKKSLRHFAAGGGKVGLLLFFFGGVLAIGSFLALLWHFMIAAALAFLALSLAAILLVLWHHRAVRASLTTPN